jgi:hypothetical protein
MDWENLKTGKSGYAPACHNEWKPGICHKPRVKCSECRHQAFVPLSDDVVRRHLGGRVSNSTPADFVVGVYPLLPDNTCRLLAVDFDGEQWRADATAFVQTCTAMGIAVGLERSRSGAGGHAWMFFEESMPARLARQLGFVLLTETMDRRPDIGFASYDRFFPSQDIMPAGGFGNLIALPLQGQARKRGNTLFLDINLQPFEDQWAFLSMVVPLSRETVERIVANAEADGRIAGVRYGCPTIMNTDQGSQFTSAAFTGALLDRGIRISMDGRGCWRDNIFVDDQADTSQYGPRLPQRTSRTRR